MDAYLESREQLIRKDRAMRVDARVVHTADDVRKRAEDVVWRVEQAEQERIWNQEHEGVMHVFPGMEFLTGKAIIMKTKLFEILVKMPKGALLHAHLDAMVNAETLMKLALEQPAMHISVPANLDASSISSTLPVFQPLSADEISLVSSSSLTEASYTPNSWVCLADARRNFAPELGGPAGFDRWINGALTISPTEAYKTHNTVTKIWQKFTSVFACTKNLVRYVPIWDQYVREFLLQSVADGVSYVEVRINFLFRFMYGTDGRETVPHRDWLIAFDRVVNEVKAHFKTLGREDEFFGARIIYSTIRFVSPEELEWYLEDCLALKQEFPHLIAGFDLVGPENALKPLIDYIEPLLKFKKRQQELGIDVPFIFHAGETLGDGTMADVNLYDAILLGTKRIGHGFSLAKHPELMKICREKGIAVEVCPISNEILRLTSSMLMHPLPMMMNQGVPVALCSDDPAIFGNMGLSFDFYQVLVASEVTNLTTLGELARDSLTHSTLEAEEQKRATALWEKRWTKFCEEVVSMDLSSVLS